MEIMKMMRPYVAAACMLSAVGCSDIRYTTEKKSPVANGYDVTLEGNFEKNYTLRVGILGEGGVGFKVRDNLSPLGLIYARDNEGDGRLDSIALYGKKGTQLEKLVSLDKLNEIYAHMRKQELAKGRQ